MFLKMYPEELKNTIDELVNIVKTENEKNCVRAISMLLKDLEEVDFLNKRAILLYLREITGLNSKQLSVILASLKKHYRDIKRKDENEIS
jgi:lipopolysaccharide biosynthesis regulator YciM